MSESILSNEVLEAAQPVTAGCHFCNRSHEPRASLRELPPELSELLKFNRETTNEDLRKLYRVVQSRPRSN
jgi:hypothetical protein